MVIMQIKLKINIKLNKSYTYIGKLQIVKQMNERNVKCHQIKQVVKFEGGLNIKQFSIKAS